jgi:hypothetical protein
VGTPGGASGNFQSRLRIISHHGCGTYGSISLRGPREEEEEDDDDDDDDDDEYGDIVNCIRASVFL